MTAAVSVSLPGSAGELVQGTKDGRSFHLTLPVALFGCTKASLNSGACLPRGWKARRALESWLAFHRREDELQNLSISVQNPLPPGKGMGSSTVDICGVLYAVAACLQIPLSEASVASHALFVEPTNGLFLPGIGMFDHRGGFYRKTLGAPPPMQVAVLDAGGAVDTRAFNSRRDLRRLNEEKEPLVLEALGLATQGILRSNAALIGRAATISALANQQILPKPCLPELVEAALSLGAVGVSAAHSGTIVGILYDRQSDKSRDGVERLLDTFGCYRLLFWTHVVGGGVRWETVPATQ